jgi:poly(ADP-ribose) glycohydrolase
VCPELVAALLFMESMQDNEAILITGYEQFSHYTGYLATFQFAGPFHDSSQVRQFFLLSFPQFLA